LEARGQKKGLDPNRKQSTPRRRREIALRIAKKNGVGEGGTKWQLVKERSTQNERGYERETNHNQKDCCVYRVVPTGETVLGKGKKKRNLTAKSEKRCGVRRINHVERIYLRLRR